MIIKPIVSVSLLVWGLSACSPSPSAMKDVPTEIDAQTTCSLDGMTLADYPGPKAQIQYAGESKPVFFCDTVELFSTLLKPEQVKAIAAVYVQDMAQTDWNKPAGHWIDAKRAYFVQGSNKPGSMGPTLASFAQQADAVQFAKANGGKVLSFAEVKPDMADLSGGADHDHKM